jgi:hypothetical protein
MSGIIEHLQEIPLCLSRDDRLELAWQVSENVSAGYGRQSPVYLSPHVGDTSGGDACLCSPNCWCENAADRHLFFFIQYPRAHFANLKFLPGSVPSEADRIEITRSATVVLDALRLSVAFGDGNDSNGTWGIGDPNVPAAVQCRRSAFSSEPIYAASDSERL